jgi:hypothetical protein
MWSMLMTAEVLRARYLVPRVGDLRARQIGVFIGSGLILLLTYGAGSWLRAETPRAQFLVGGSAADTSPSRGRLLSCSAGAPGSFRAGANSA